MNHEDVCLLTVGGHSCGSRGSLCVGSFHGLCVCLVENSLENLLFFPVQNLGQVFVELRLFLLKA